MKNKLRSTLLLFFFLSVISQSLFAQDKITVSGTVTDATDGGPIPGVTVTIKGTTLGTAADAQGHYQLKNVDGKGTIIFTYIGYKTLEVPINNRTTVNAALELTTQALEQVVVVGYGTAKKKDLTASIANVKGEELAKQPIQTPTQAMQGKVAGVQVISSGEPNSQPSVRVRGTGSTLGGVEPLYVVDGVLTDDIRNINNSDIASMDILKDASAAIYGVRAANGVIIITTKKGKDGKAVVRYDGNAGFREATNLVTMASRDQYLSYLEVAAPTKVDPGPPLTVDNTVDWYDAILRNAFQTNHNVSLSGGSEKYNYYFSGGYLNEDGIITTNDFNRFTFRANNEATISPKFKFTSQVSFSRSENRAVDLGDTYRSIYRAAPIVPTKIDNLYGNTSLWGNVANPLLSLEKRNSNIRNDRIQGNAGLEYFITKELRFKTIFNTDKSFGKTKTYLYQFENDSTTFLEAGGGQRNPNSNLTVREDDNFRWIWDNTLTYEKTFAEKHTLTLLGGAVTEEGTTSFISGDRINVPADPDLWFLSLGDATSPKNDNGGTKFARQSYVARVSYNYASKYLFSGSFRADGSSKFKEKWGYFPTLGFGWVMTEEDFLKKQKLFDFLKLRINWGILGNDNIPTDAYISLLSINVPYVFDKNIILGATIPDLKDANIKWEKTEEFDVGLDFTLLDNRLSGEMDYYNKNVRDALTNIPVPGQFGDSNNEMLTNAASFKNSGFEFGLRWDDLIKDDFHYNIGFNMTFNHNEVTDLSGGKAIFSGGVGQQPNTTKTDIGQPIGSFFLLRNIGVFQTQEEINNYVGPNGTPLQPTAVPGDLKYENFNNDDVIDDKDRQFFGSYQPKFYYGINLGAAYKGFDISTDFYGNVGNKIYNGKNAFRYEGTDNIESDYANSRWTPTNPSSSQPRVITGSMPASTYFLESGSFFRLNNITIGYTLADKTLEKSGIASLRFYITGQNVFTIKSFSGFSPELPSAPLDGGIELNAYPTTRTFAFGVNLSF